MTREEILSKLVRTGPHTFELNAYSNFFNKVVKIEIFSGSSTSEVIVLSDYLVKCINEFAAYGSEEKVRIAADVYENYKIYISTTDYGMVSDELRVKYRNDTTLANQEFFGINNPEEAYAALTFKYAHVVEYSMEESSEETHFGMFFDRPWDDEHELQLLFANGKYKELDWILPEARDYE